MTFSQMTNKEHTFSHADGVTDKLNNFFLQPTKTFLFTFSGLRLAFFKPSYIGIES